MKKLLLFFMAIAMFVAPSCTGDGDGDFTFDGVKDPVVKLVGATATDTGVFRCDTTESQSFLVVVDANNTLYPAANGTNLKSWILSTDDFEVEYLRSTSTLVVTPVSKNYEAVNLEAELLVKLNNNIGGGETSIKLTQNHPVVGHVSFEDSEKMVTPFDSIVSVGDYAYNHYAPLADTTYNNIYYASEDKGYTFVEETFYSSLAMVYDGISFLTADSMVQFGQYITKAEAGESWNGFALSQNYMNVDSLVAEVTPALQFSAWGEPASDDNKTFALAYYSDFGKTYEKPVIYFNDTVELSKISVCNAAYMYGYHSKNATIGGALYCDVKFTGVLGDKETKSVSEQLVMNDSLRLEGWVEVDLRRLGAVTSVEITFESNDVDPILGLNVPAYVALDDLYYIKSWE